MRPWNYFAMSRKAKNSADRAYEECQKQKTARVQARQDARVGVATATGTTGAQVLYGELGDLGGQIAGALLPGSVPGPSDGSAYGPPPVVEDKTASPTFMDTIAANPIPVAAVGIAAVYLLTRGR